METNNNTKGFELKPETVDLLKGWMYEEREIDEPVIKVHIKSIGEAEDFLLEYIGLGRPEEKCVAGKILLGLHFVKGNLKELVESMKGGIQ